MSDNEKDRQNSSSGSDVVAKNEEEKAVSVKDNKDDDDVVFKGDQVQDGEFSDLLVREELWWSCAGNG